VDSDHVQLPDFLAHNGTSEKLRRANAQRQANYRHRHAQRNVTRDVTPSNASNDARPDQTRLDQKEKQEGAAAQPADVPRLSKLQKAAEPDWMPAFRKRYPRRSGSQRWESARRHAVKRLAEGHTVAEIMAGVDRYAAYCVAEGILGRREVQQAATFLGEDKGFLEPWTPSPPKNGKSSPIDQDTRNREGWTQRAARIGFRGPRDDESLQTYIAAVEDAEQRRSRLGPLSFAQIKASSGVA
jgi:hypothetical protein